MTTQATDRALRLPEIILRTGMSRSWIYSQVAAGAFPKPLKAGARASAWLESEFASWLSARAEQRAEKKVRAARGGGASPTAAKPTMTLFDVIAAGGEARQRACETLVIARALQDPPILIMCGPRPRLTEAAYRLLQVIRDEPSLAQQDLAVAVIGSVSVLEDIGVDMLRLAQAAMRLTAQEIASCGSLTLIVDLLTEQPVQPMPLPARPSRAARRNRS